MDLATIKKFKDEEILTLSLEQPAAFEELVNRYQPGFVRAAGKILNDFEESRDAVQDAFVKIYLNAGQFKKMEGAGFKSWAYKIVINTALTRYGKIKRACVLTESMGIDLGKAVQESFDGTGSCVDFETDMKAVVSKTIEKMPGRLGEILRKYYLEEKSQKEIAIEEGISVPSVKMRLFRAKRVFKQTIGEDKNLSLCLTWI